MGSVGFEVEDESQPSTSIGKKCKLPRTHPDNGGAVNHASVPKKRRSGKIGWGVTNQEKEKERDYLEPSDSIRFCNDIKKRGRKSVTSQLPISKKHHHVSNGFEMLKKDGGKRSTPNKKQGHITKDEEEVAETLYALAAGVFSDASKNKQPVLPNESPEEESKKTVSKLPIVAACDSSNMVDAEGKVVEFQSLGDDAQKPELSGSKQLATSSASGIQYGKNSQPVDDKNNVAFPSPNSSTSVALRSEKQTSCIRPSINRVPDCTNSTPQPLSIQNTGAAEKHAPARVEPEKSRKRCLAHVHITYLIKDLQVSEEKERSLEKATWTTTYGDAGLGSHIRTHNQQTRISGRNDCISFNGTSHSAMENELTKIQNDTSPSHKRSLQDQQHVSKTCSSAYQGFDFLSLGGSDPSDNRVNRKILEAPKQFQVPYQSQSNTALLFSPSHNGFSVAYHGHNSSLPAQQVQLFQYPGSTVNSSFSARLGQQLDPQQQKWAAELATQYDGSGVGALQWKNGERESHSILNYGHAHTLFPHLQSAVRSKYHQQLLHSQQQHQQLMGLHSMPSGVSNVRRNLHHLPLGLERNGGGLYQHVQLPCNQHLSN